MNEKLNDFLKAHGDEKVSKKLVYSPNTLQLLQDVFELGLKNAKCSLCGTEMITEEEKCKTNKVISRKGKRIGKKLYKKLFNFAKLKQQLPSAGLPDNLYNL